MSYSKHFKLQIHEQSFSQDDVVISNDSGLNVGDIIEVYHPDGEYSRLLVKIKHFENLQKGYISINSSLASSFCLRQYNDVVVNLITNVNAVTLDVLELVFKDQFVTRSDTWRLHRSLIGSCVYYCNKVTFTNMRVNVHEMWMKGSKVACGVVGDATKIVYRSVSAKFHIFVQMSAEMWEFDHSGDLYFEKAIMGFMQELFHRWKDEALVCNHNVVIVLFSRTYYDAQSIDEFSKEMQKEVICSSDGRYYRDFYKIIKQSEKQDDLQNIILEMKSSFNGYPLYVGCQQPLPDERHSGISPKGLGTNSRAEKGNLLEAINMSLNVFEQLYIDCNLEETNCTALVITPSTGVFEVNEELSCLTRNRLIENGVRVDLVCLAEQPLHAVPLLKFVSSKNGKQDIYNVPQWLNLSYYSKEQAQGAVFVPRMQVPQGPSVKDMVLERSTPTTSGVLDFDEFDSKVFDYSALKYKDFNSRGTTRQTNVLDKYASTHSSPEVSKSVNTTNVVKKLSLHEEANIHHLMRSISEDQGRRALYRSYDDLKFTMATTEVDNTPKFSSEQLIGDGRKQHILNPFKPQHMANAITLFKYRWLDVINFQGKNIEENQEKVVVSEPIESSAKSPSPDVVESSSVATEAASLPSIQSNTNISREGCDDKLSTTGSKTGSIFDVDDSTGDSLSRVDWKSLCMPACLPLTINFFPEENNLRQNYRQYHYTMIMEDLEENGMHGEKEHHPHQDKGHGKDTVGFDRNSMPPEKKFMEMISQRIGQGFQFVTKSDVGKILKLGNASMQSMEFDPKRDYVLSMGNIIHHLKLNGTEVDVTRYSPCEPFVPKPVTYRYNLWPHNNQQYSLVKTEFSYELASQYNWNNLDRYICTTEFNQFNEQMKYWRTRFLLLPIRQHPLSASPPVYDSMQQIEAFLKFLEGMNKLKRGSVKRQLFIGRRNRFPIVHHDSFQRLKGDRRSLTPDRSDKKDSTPSSMDKKTSPLRPDSQDMKDMDFSGTPRPASFCGAAPDNMPPENSLSMKSTRQEIIKAMLHTDYGLPFLPPQEDLRENTFISAEAVAWMIKSIDGCNTKRDAVRIGQNLLEEKCIIHASESARQCFIDGFFLYYIKQEKKEEETEKRRFWFGSKKSEEELLKSYNIQWLEAAVWRQTTDQTVPAFLEEEVIDPRSLVNASSTASIKDEDPLFKNNTVPLYKSMEYNLEADQKSNRSEWCTLFYHGNYYPNKCAYSIELNWMVATCSIIADLVQKWSHKGTSCGVHVVPAPMCVFPRSNNPRCFRNPLRGSPFIPLNVDCLMKEGQTHLFEAFDVNSWSTRMFLFHEAILRRFDFLRDIPRTAPETISNPANKTYQYIHSSGSIIMKINNIFLKDLKGGPSVNDGDCVESPFRKTRRPSKKPYGDKVDYHFEDAQYKDVYGFFWVYNWALSKKWQSSYTGDVVSSKIFVRKVSDFCSNKDDQLVQFWQEACQAATDYLTTDSCPTPGNATPEPPAEEVTEMT